MLTRCNQTTGLHLSNHTPTKVVLCSVNASAVFHLSVIVTTHSFDFLSLPLHLLTTGLPSTPLMVSPYSALPSNLLFLVLPFQEGCGSVSLASMDGSFFFTFPLGKNFMPNHFKSSSFHPNPLRWSKCCPFSTAVTTQIACAVLPSFFLKMFCEFSLQTESIWNPTGCFSIGLVTGSTDCSNAVSSSCPQTDRRSLCTERGRGWLCDLWHLNDLKAFFSQPEESIFHWTAE